MGGNDDVVCEEIGRRRSWTLLDIRSIGDQAQQVGQGKPESWNYTNWSTIAQVSRVVRPPASLG